MKRGISFDDALDSALSSVLEGVPLDDVIARFPEHSEELRELLPPAVVMSPFRKYEPPSGRLMEASVRVQAAVGTARRNVRSMVEEPRRNPWWRRRAAFASTFAPIAILAFALFGAGAATASVALNPKVGNNFADQIEQVTPGWSHRLIPGGEHGSSSAGSETDQALTAVPGHVGSPTRTPHVPAPLVAVTVGGAVEDIRGSVFNLVSSSRTYVVQTDANTSITGDLREGVAVMVHGVLSANDRIHATVVTGPPSVTPVSAPDSAATMTELTPPPEDSSTRVAGSASGTPPGQVVKTKTPRPPKTTRTPGQPDKTKTPGPPS